MQGKSSFGGDVILCVYRLVATDDREAIELEQSFWSNKKRGKPARGPEKRCKAIWESLSMYLSGEGAQDQYSAIVDRVRLKGETPVIGPFVARLSLPGDCGFYYMDSSDPTGHVSVWGDPLDLVARVEDIFPADPNQH